MRFWSYKYEWSSVYSIDVNRNGITIDFGKWQFGVEF